METRNGRLPSITRSLLALSDPNYLRGAGELTIFGAAFIGAGLGFLWYNAFPAQIFMGDTGSLAIGGAMAVVSVLLKQEMLFPLLGGLFLAEAFTSQIQDKIGVRWLGRRQDEWSAADAACVRAYVPQQAVDRFPISVERLLALSVVRAGALAAGDVLAALDAGSLRQRGVRELSGGERQRVALAQCALQGAPLLLMDEPVSFQDPAHQALVSRWLNALVGAGGERALVASAHDVNWICTTATHVLALLGDGGWVAGPTAEVITAERLEQVYGCAWREAAGTWVAR